MTDKHTLVERLLTDAAETEKLVANLERQHGDPADGMISLFANMRRKAADQTEAATRITALEAEKAELVAHLRQMITAVTEFGPHCGFWDWRNDASTFLATLAKHQEGEGNE